MHPFDDRDVLREELADRDDRDDARRDRRRWSAAPSPATTRRAHGHRPRRSWTAGSPSAAACSSPSPASGSTATTTPTTAVDAGAAAVLSSRDTGHPGGPGRRRRSPRSHGWPAHAARPAARRHGWSRSPGRRARPAPRTCWPQVLADGRPDRRHLRLVQQRARAAADRAARRRRDTESWCSRWAPAHIGDLRGLVRDRAARTCRWCSTSARRTSGSSAPSEAHRAGQGRDRRGARRGRRRGAQRRRPAGRRRWPPAPRARVVHLRHRPVRRRPLRRAGGRRPRPPVLRAAYRAERATVAMGWSASTTPATPPPPPRWRSRSGSPLDDVADALGAADRDLAVAAWRCTSGPTA